MPQYGINKQIGQTSPVSIGFIASYDSQVSNLSSLKDSYVAQGADVKIDETETFTIVFQKTIYKFTIVETPSAD